MKGNKILIIIVLYKNKLENSESYLSLKRYIHNLSGIDYNILVYNNSPEINIPKSIEYSVVNAKENKMLCGAYNYALDHATKNKSKWLLLLDQDTSLNENYFFELRSFLNSNQDKEIVAVVPVLKNKDIILSPKEISLFLWSNKNVKHRGYTKGKITAFNSVSLLSVNYLNQIGGFSEEYPLDMLDHWCYHQISKDNKNVYVLNVELEHDLSLLDYEKNVSLSRYEGFLDAEYKFVRKLGIIVYISYKLRLLLRFLKQLLFFKNKTYSQKTLIRLLRI